MEVVEDAGGIGAEPDQERWTEVHQQVPGHRKHAEVIGDGEQAQNVAGDIERQRRGDEDDDQADEDRPGEERAAQHDLAPAINPRGRTYITATSSKSAGIAR